MPAGDFHDDKLKVLQATPIERLIGEHLTLKPKGRELVGLCPFHDDQNPSMFVVPAKQLYKCFSCGAGGDAITFVMDYHQMSFREALAFLAERAGIKLTPWRGRAQGEREDQAPTVSRGEIIEANQFAAEYFKAILRHPEHGAGAREVIARRGVSPEMVEKFALGAAADKWDGLALTVASKQRAVEPFIAAGLLRRRENASGVYDVFRNRLMFPITDQLGRVIAFGARRINDADEPKYLNSSDSPAFSKSGTIYALPLAVPAIRAAGAAIITEGYMDTIACHQAGITSAVATLGTALTPTHAKVLARLGKTLYLLFDGDEAGQRAADRAVEVLFASNMDVKIATLSSLKGVQAKDPDELLKLPDGRARFDEMLKSAKDALQYRFERFATTLRGLGVAARGALIDAEMRRIAELGLAKMSPPLQIMTARHIASITGVDVDDILKQIKQIDRGLGPSKPSATALQIAGAAVVRASTPAQRVLAYLLNDPSLASELSVEQRRGMLSPEAIAHPLLEKVAIRLDSMLDAGNSMSTQSVMAALDDPSLSSAVTSLVAEITRMTSNEPSRLRPAFAAEVGRAWHDVLMARAQATMDRDEKFRLVRRAKAALLGGNHDAPSS